MYRFEVWVSQKVDKAQLEALKEKLVTEFGSSIEEKPIN
jgi:hypothetical protein